MLTIGSRLKLLFKNINITQKQISEEINMAMVTISTYVTDKRIPDIKLLNHLYQKYNVNINWLLFGEGELYISKNVNDNIDEEVYVRIKDAITFLHKIKENRFLLEDKKQRVLFNSHVELLSILIQD